MGKCKSTRKNMQNYHKAISLKQVKGGLRCFKQPWFLQLFLIFTLFTLLGSVPYPLPADTFESVIFLFPFGPIWTCSLSKRVASCGEQ